MDTIARQRLQHQGITGSTFTSPSEVVAHMGAIQAQDYAGAKWAVGLRLPGSTDAGIERALADRSIVRTWAIRGTLHFVAAKDVQWLLALVAPMIIRKNARRYRELGLDERTLERSSESILDALQGGRLLDRRSLRKILEEKGIDTEGQRFPYMLQRASLEGTICQVGMRHNNPVFSEFRGPSTGDEPRSRGDALAELAKRYFAGHGPATLEDFSWWSGLPAADARAGLEAIKEQLTRVITGGLVYWCSRTVPEFKENSSKMYLLPGFDEYMIGYRDHGATLDVLKVKQLVFKNGIISPAILVNGRVGGTWTRTIGKGKVVVTGRPFTPFLSGEHDEFIAAAIRYGEFLGLPVEFG
jgi:hypothetical protein